MKTEFFSPLLERAMRVAARCHRHQSRKASDLPYLSHPASVVIILLRAGFDEEELLAAALLHDVVEDTDYSPEDVQREFPPRVAQYVAALTERKTESDGAKRSWQDRKEEHIEQVRRAGAEARAILLADKLHNLGAMLFDLQSGRELWSRFGAPPERILWYHRTIVEAAAEGHRHLKPLAAACRGLISRLEETVQRQEENAAG